MFNRALAAGLGFLFVLTGLLTFALIKITHEDRADYQGLLQRTISSSESSPLLMQERKGIVKEIRSADHHLKISCESSDLSLSHESTWEEMRNLDGTLDHLNTFHAARGWLDYRSHRFVGEDCTLSGEDLEASAGKMTFFLSEGSREDQNVVLEGDPQLKKRGAILTADCIRIFQKNGQLQWAQTEGKTTLTLPNQEALDCLGTVTIDPKAQTIATAGGRVRYTEQQGWFSADEMVVNYETQQGKDYPTKIELRGDVRIGSLDQDLPLHCALADEATYLPQSHLMTLKAHEERRVLFLDEASDTRMSAKEIVADTQERAAKGIGGVRCFFQEEEFNRLKKVIE